jgi:hypothetical protein
VREVVGHRAQADHPGDQEAGPHQEGQQGGQGAVALGVVSGQGDQGRRDQGGDGAFGADDELAGGTEQGVGDGREQQRVQAGHRGQPGQQVAAEGAAPVRGELLGDRQQPVHDRPGSPAAGQSFILTG